MCVPHARPAARLALILMGAVILSLCAGQGCPGTPSPGGTDAQPTVYGDSSAGDLTVNTDSLLSALVPSGNFQFGNITINAGSTLTVASGTVLRCTGVFTNHGTLLVSTGVEAPQTAQVALPGISLAGAEPGAAASPADLAMSGPGGQGLTADQALNVLAAPIAAGGAGGTTLFQRGGAGGGSVLLLVQGTIANSGTIQADGQDGPLVSSGGGAGGIIILASPTAIANAGSILARGGDGGAPGDSFGGGGGGGGGIVRLLSPSISAGSIDVTPGEGRGSSSISTLTAHFGGAGGGACGGNGGFGGTVSNSPLNTANSGQAGSIGQIINTLTNPTSLF